MLRLEFEDCVDADLWRELQEDEKYLYFGVYLLTHKKGDTLSVYVYVTTQEQDPVHPIIWECVRDRRFFTNRWTTNDR